jgi:hypothetical protein
MTTTSTAIIVVLLGLLITVIPSISWILWKKMNNPDRSDESDRSAVTFVPTKHIDTEMQDSQINYSISPRIDNTQSMSNCNDLDPNNAFDIYDCSGKATRKTIQYI